jgi:hypothetical protein
MFKYLLCVLVVVLVFIVAHLTITNLSPKQENFQSIETDVEIGHPDFALRDTAETFHGSTYGSPGDGTPSVGGAGAGPPSGGGVDLDDYVSRSDIERAARASTQKYCPVSPDYNPSDYIKKTEIDFATACPKMPDLKDYVLKSTIPPIQKCPSCICPKVKVSAGMCKECPKPKNNCPKCEPCGSAECRDVIQCAPGDQQVSCPNCPSPQPCPNPPEKVCPAFELPVSDIKCPSPKPCALPGMCPDKQGRCPEKPESKCKYYGIKEIAKERSTNDLVNEMLLSDDPKLKELLESLKYKLNLNLEPSPTEKMYHNNLVTTTTATTAVIEKKKQTVCPISTPDPAPTTSQYKIFNPKSHNNSDEQYEFNSYRYSTINNLDYLEDPKPTFNSKIANNVLNESDTSLGCDVNDGNCSYNTNLNI